MADDFEKLLEKIKADNIALQAAQKSLGEALEKLDERLTMLQAGVRIEPYQVAKGGPVIGFRRFHDGWHITTHLEGISDIVSETPAIEAKPEVQVELMPHVAPLLKKISDAIAGKVKQTSSAVKEADKILDALRNPG
jgi:hypothetical protein